MKIHDLAFFAAAFFISGVLLASFLESAVFILAAVLLLALFFSFAAFLGRRGAVALTLLLPVTLAGAFYFRLYRNAAESGVDLPFGQKLSFEGRVISDPDRSEAAQKFVLEIDGGGKGKIILTAARYPTIRYGDRLKFQGKIEKPGSESYANYLKKDGIFGTARADNFKVVGGEGLIIKSALFSFKGKIEDNLRRALPPSEAAFLSGIILGERAEFSAEFKKALALSGTSHLVALSGYNITVIASLAASAFSFFVSRRRVLLPSVALIAAFVTATGAEASVVRAAIMGTALLLVNWAERPYNARNVVTFAAFLMTLANPLVLRFDVGFQLSFSALLGIICLEPALKKAFKFKVRERDFLNWRENVFTTAAAQAAVVPILILNFGQFSLVSLLANVLILGFVPITMLLGFLIGFLGFFSHYFALIPGIIVHGIVSYEIFVIKASASFGGKLLAPAMGAAGAVIYYLILAAFAWFYSFLKR